MGLIKFVYYIGRFSKKHSHIYYPQTFSVQSSRLVSGMGNFMSISELNEPSSNQATYTISTINCTVTTLSWEGLTIPVPMNLRLLGRQFQYKIHIFLSKKHPSSSTIYILHQGTTNTHVNEMSRLLQFRYVHSFFREGGMRVFSDYYNHDIKCFYDII